MRRDRTGEIIDQDDDLADVVSLRRHAVDRLEAEPVVPASATTVAAARRSIDAALKAVRVQRAVVELHDPQERTHRLALRRARAERAAVERERQRRRWGGAS